MDALLDLTKDIWDFLRVRKKYWLAPLIITIVLMGALIVFTQGLWWRRSSTRSSDRCLGWPG